MNSVEAQKASERGAARIFLNRHHVCVEEILNSNTDDIVDVLVPGVNLKFQVVGIDAGGPDRLLRDGRALLGGPDPRDGRIPRGYKIEEISEAFILRPLRKKYEKYRGVGTAEIILLIHVIQLPELAWLQKAIDGKRPEVEELVRINNFKEVWLVADIANLAFRIG